MRKLLTIVAGTLVTGSLFAGGLVTNTNQSAAWVRMPSRNASVEIDAVYYNPAGLMKLENGFHFSLSNQTIWQKREIDNSYEGLNEHLYTGKVFAPLFPSIYAAYKFDKWALSFGFMPVGGGGGATYKKGLPSFEMSISDLVPGLASQGFDAYSADISFKGSSVFFGYQGTLSYKINDVLSIAAGARYVTAKNTYSGHLQNIQLGIGGTWLPATSVFDGIIGQLTSFIGVPSALSTPIGLGLGGVTLQYMVDNYPTQMTAAMKSQIEQGLVTLLQVPSAALPTLTLNQISGLVTTYTPQLTATKAKASATRTLLSDKTADVVQKGSGVTPIFSVNISPTENLNIAIKYEMATKIELVNNTKQDLLIGYTLAGDSITQFPDGEKTRNDMPAMLAVGIDYKISPKLKVAVGLDYYFDKKADYGHTTKGMLPSTPAGHLDNVYIIKENGYAIEGGIEYNISDKILVSGGYVWANKGVNSRYQSDLTFANSTHSFGAGGAYSITDKIKINLGAAYTMYVKDTQDLYHYLSGTYEKIKLTESYKKTTFIVGLGVDFRF